MVSRRSLFRFAFSRAVQLYWQSFGRAAGTQYAGTRDQGWTRVLRIPGAVDCLVREKRWLSRPLAALLPRQKERMAKHRTLIRGKLLTKASWRRGARHHLRSGVLGRLQGGMYHHTTFPRYWYIPVSTFSPTLVTAPPKPAKAKQNAQRCQLLSKRLLPPHARGYSEAASQSHSAE